MCYESSSEIDLKKSHYAFVWMQKRICYITPTYLIMGYATAAGVRRRRNPQERLNRDSDLKPVEKLVAEMSLIP